MSPLSPSFRPWEWTASIMAARGAGGFLFLTAFGAMVYGWLSEKPIRVVEERKPQELKKAA